MANTLSLMTNVLRNAVSKQRIRYTENGFNLDLAYICENIIAMGYPADNYEGIYRNRIDDVYQFFEGHHRDHYKIYNLCSERSYDINKFHGRVAVYPFDDHNPPTIELIQNFCDDVDRWLKADKKNVAAVHCKAGKGRTGTMICCYLLHSGFTTTAEDALAYYDEKRTKDKKGVTIPSQRRYVEYYSRLIRSGKPYEKRTLQICEIKFSSPLQIHSQGTVLYSISSLPDPSAAEKAQLLHTAPIDFRKSQSIEFKDCCKTLTGDVKIEVYHKVMRKKERYFHFWFNTFFVCENAESKGEGDEIKYVREFTKTELDDAHKDKEHKNFPEDFKVHIVLKPVPRGFVSGNDTSRNNHFMLHNQCQNHKNHDQHNNQLPKFLLKNTINSQTTPIGPILEATGGSLLTPKILPENNKIQNQLNQQQQIQLQQQQNTDSKRKHHHHHSIHNNSRRGDYGDVVLSVSVKDQNATSAGHQSLQQHAHDNPSNVHSQHTPSVSPDVSRTNSSSSSSISSEASSAAGEEDWESGELKPKGTIMMMTDGRKNHQNYNNSSSYSKRFQLSDLKRNNNNNHSSSVGLNKTVNASNNSSSATSSKLISFAGKSAIQHFKAKAHNTKACCHHHKISNTNKKKIRWLSNFKTDPELCESLVKPVTFHKHKHLHDAPATVNLGQSRTNSGTDHDDYYSSLCDRQLSFSTSPCKSPKSITMLPTVSSAGEEVNRHKTIASNIVIAKPIESHSIGFNVLTDKYNKINSNESGKSVVKKSDSYDEVIIIASEKQTSADGASLTSSCDSGVKLDMIQDNNIISKTDNNEQNNICDKMQSLLMLSTVASSSPPARFGNRCVPFSFRGIRQELQSVIKQNSSKTKSNRSNSCTIPSSSTNRFSLGMNNKKKNSLPATTTAMLAATMPTTSYSSSSSSYASFSSGDVVDNSKNS